MSCNTSDSTGPVIHLICGSTGAGKSTFARQLSNKIGAVHLSIDDWMMSLFWPDVENPLDWKWISERAIRCENQILSLAISLAQNGTSSILEIGLQRANRRLEVASAIAESGCAFQTSFLLVDPEQRWERVKKRNDEKGETYHLTITKDIFDFFEEMWEAPNEDELIALNASVMEMTKSTMQMELR